MLQCLALPALACRWQASGRRRSFLPATPTTLRSRSNLCWTGLTEASCPKERRGSNPHTMLVMHTQAPARATVLSFNCCLNPLSVPVQTATLWTTRSWTCLCRTTFPVPSGPEWACARARAALRNPTAEVLRSGVGSKVTSLRAVLVQHAASLTTHCTIRLTGLLLRETFVRQDFLLSGCTTCTIWWTVQVVHGPLSSAVEHLKKNLNRFLNDLF